MTLKQPKQNSAQGVQLGGPAPARITTNSEESADPQCTTMDPAQRAALDRVYGWLFAPIGEDEGQVLGDVA